MAVKLDIDFNKVVKIAVAPVDSHLDTRGPFSDTDNLVDFRAAVGTMGEELCKVIVEIAAAGLSGMDRTVACRLMRVRAIVMDPCVRSEQDLRRSSRI